MTELESRLRFWRMQRLRALGVEGAVRFAGVLAGVLLAAVLLDWFLVLPQSVRWGMFAAGSAALSLGVYRFFLQPLALLEPSRVLRSVSERYPELRVYLSSAWELSRGPSAPNTSKDLVDEHISRTDKLLDGVPRETVFSAKPSKRAAKRLTFVAAAWGLGMPWLMGGHANFQRVLAPWRDVVLDAMIRVEPGDKRVSWGESVNIRVVWRSGGKRSADLDLYIREKPQEWHRVPWDGGGAGFLIEKLVNPFNYRIGFKELRSRVYRLTPVPFPHLSGVSVRVRLPGRGPAIREMRLEGGGEIAALRRSWVTLRGRPDQELGSAELKVSYLGTPVKMRRLESGEWEGGFPLNENGTLKIDLVSEEGARDPRPVAYGLRALEDKPPEVELLSPAFELEISPKERLTVTYEATDDYGLTSLSLLYRVGKGVEKVVPLAAFKRPPEQYIDDYSWDLSRLPVGARVEFRIRALDNNRPASQLAVSNKGIIHLVDFATMHASAERMWLGAEEALRRLARREGEMRKLLEEMGKAAADAKRGPEAQQALESLFDEMRRSERALDKTWDQVVSELKRFAESMRQDPYANPGMTQASSMLAKALKSLRDRELSKAKAEAAAKRFPEAAERHQQLETDVERALKILEAGREMQKMQDFWGDAHRMDQAAGEIQEALGEISKSGKPPTAAQKKKLQQALSKLQQQMAELTKTIDSLPKAAPDSERDRARKVYRIPLGDARRSADALQRALARGDYQEAARLAKQLSRQLQKMRRAISRAAEGFSRGEDKVVREMVKTKRLWEEVVAQQSRSLEMTNQLEDKKLAERMQAQKNLLRELARLQNEVLRDAGRLGRRMPANALRWMKRVLKEFKAERVEKAPDILKRIAARLDAEAAKFQPKDGTTSEIAETLTGLSEREKDIRDRLARGAPEPPLSESRMSGMMAASAVQRQTRRKTEQLGRQLESLSKNVGMIPPDARESVAGAQAEQKKAEESLSRRDSAATRGHQQKALDLLQKGKKSLADALSKQQSIQKGSTRPFGRPRGMARPFGGRGGRTGIDKGFVPLPGAKDYQPPEEIRREIEKSLRERRPKIFDETVDDYLKRMSQ